MVDLPHEALVAKVNHLNISKLSEEDMRYFCNISSLEAADNCIQFEKLKDLISLNDLNLNSITIPLLSDDNIHNIENINDKYAFCNLEILNLAWNKLSINSIIELTKNKKN